MSAERANITHFHRIDQNKKYDLFIIITSSSDYKFVNLDLCFRQGMNNYRINDPEYRLRYNIRVSFKEDPKYCKQLLSNQVTTDELINEFEKKYSGSIDKMKSMLV